MLIVCLIAGSHQAVISASFSEKRLVVVLKSGVVGTLGCSSPGPEGMEVNDTYICVCMRMYEYVVICEC